MVFMNRNITNALASGLKGTTGGGSPSPIKRFDFSSLTLDSDIQYIRNDTTSTYRDNTGALQKVSAAHTPRFDHDINGNFLGILSEANGTNKTTNENANPVNTTGMTTSGDAAGVLSVVSDSAQLASAKLNNVCTNGNVYLADNSSGVATFTVNIGGTVGNTNAHSIHLYARGTGTGRSAIITLGDDDLDIAPAGGGYEYYELINQTPDGTGRQFTITVDAGDSVYFTLFQMEEKEFATSTVIGANAFRDQDIMRLNNINTLDYFDETQGYMSMRCIPAATAPPTQYFFAATNNTSNESIGVRYSNGGDAYLRGWVRANGGTTQHANTARDRPQANSKMGTFVTWDATKSTIGSNGAIKEQPTTTPPSGLTFLNIGGRNAHR